MRTLQRRALKDGPHRPVLHTVRFVDDAIAMLWSNAGERQLDRLHGRQITWMVADCCAAPEMIAALDALLKFAPVEASTSMQLVALTMTTHMLHDHLPSRSAFLRRARARLLLLGSTQAVESLSDLRNAGPVLT